MGEVLLAPMSFLLPMTLIFFSIVFADGDSFRGVVGNIRGDGAKRESLLLTATEGDTEVIMDTVDVASLGGPSPVPPALSSTTALRLFDLLNNSGMP